jgi:hypothetical protein
VLRRLLFFTLLAITLILAARVGEQYTWRLDLSAQQINSLSVSARRALDALTDELEMTVFLPDYPVQRAQLEQLLAPYLAHSEKLHLNFIDPVKEPDRARALGAARHGELQLRMGQRLEVIATPTAAAIDRALNRLALRGDRWIVSFKGHGEAGIDETPTGIGRFVSHVENLGYRFITIDPRHIGGLPENTEILLIAGPQRDYGEHTRDQIKAYLASGGRLLWLTGGQLPDFIDTELGVEPLPGTVVDAAAALHGLDSPDNAIVSEYPPTLIPQAPDRHSVLKQAQALNLRERENWRLAARLQSSPGSWNETGELRGSVARNPELGEQAGPLTVALALQKAGADQDQRIAIVGSSHFIGNDQIGQAGNMALAVGLLHWLSANDQLSSTPIAQDLDIHWPPRLAGLLAVALMGVMPAIYLATGLWSRSRRRKA